MKTIITAWPVDRQLQEKIGIYQNSTVKSQSVGRVLSQLVKAGYATLQSFVENRQNDITKKDEHVIVIHCEKGV